MPGQVTLCLVGAVPSGCGHTGSSQALSSAGQHPQSQSLNMPIYKVCAMITIFDALKTWKYVYPYGYNSDIS